MTGQGVCSRSSHSEAAGRTTFSAKPWTQSRMSFWSWLSSRENSVAVASAAAVVSVMVTQIVTSVYTCGLDGVGKRTNPHGPRAGDRRRHARAVRGGGHDGGGGRRHRAGRRHQQGAHLPARRLQGGAL